MSEQKIKTLENRLDYLQKELHKVSEQVAKLKNENLSPTEAATSSVAKPKKQSAFDRGLARFFDNISKKFKDNYGVN